MNESLDTQIRMALDAKAHEVEVPSELAARTLERASGQQRQPLVDRVGSWRDARSTHRIASSAGIPRWTIVAAGGLAALLLFVVGSVAVNGWGPGRSLVSPTSGEEGLNFEARRTDDDGRVIVDSPALKAADDVSGDAVAGQVTGVVSSGDSSVDAQNRSEDVDLETGDASGAVGKTSVDANASTGDEKGSNSAASFTGLTAGSDSLVAQDILDGASVPKLVRAAEIEVAVNNFEDAWGDANDIASKHQGHVIDSKTTQVADEIAKGTVTMRVPTSRLEDVLADLRDLGTLARLDTTGDDISEQIASVDEQLTDRKQDEKELTELLSRAGTLTEQNDIRKRRTDVRKKIENLEAKAADQRDKISTSIVRATIVQDEVAAGRGGTIVGNAADTAGQLFLTITAGLVVLLAALAPVAILTAALSLAIRAIRKRRSGASS